MVAGVDRIIEAIERFRFDDETVAHLMQAGVVSDAGVADWLRSYRFSGDVTGYPDGELFFPYSPVLTVEGGFAECVILETVVLSILNHDCPVASAAARVRDVADGRRLIEGGSRRTDPDAAVAAARAAHIGGFDTTSNLEAGRRYGIPTGGTTAHAFVLAHPDERAAFAAQRDALGTGSTYLVDTFDVLEGIRRAVEVVGSGHRRGAHRQRQPAGGQHPGPGRARLARCRELPHRGLRRPRRVPGGRVGGGGCAHRRLSGGHEPGDRLGPSHRVGGLQACRHRRLRGCRRAREGRRQALTGQDHRGRPQAGAPHLRRRGLLAGRGAVARGRRRSGGRPPSPGGASGGRRAGLARRPRGGPPPLRGAPPRPEARGSGPAPSPLPAIPTEWVGMEAPAATESANGAQGQSVQTQRALGADRGGIGMRKALIICDVQNDFCEGGSLAVESGHAVADSITDLVGLDRADGGYGYVVASKDWHIDPGEHFAAPGTNPDFVTSWPVHCAAGTQGAAFSPRLQVALDEVFLKGQYSSGYSSFEGVSGSSDDVGLRDWLAERGVEAVDVVGIATDYCVRATALDAAAAGFETSVLVAHCAGVAPDSSAAALEELVAAGVTIVD